AACGLRTGGAGGPARACGRPTPGATALLRRAAPTGCGSPRPPGPGGDLIGQPHDRGAARAALRGRVAAAVLERERTAMRLGDLARECEPDAGALGLRGEERHEQVRGVGDARPLV